MSYLRKIPEYLDQVFVFLGQESCTLSSMHGHKNAFEHCICVIYKNILGTVMSGDRMREPLLGGHDAAEEGPPDTSRAHESSLYASEAAPTYTTGGNGNESRNMRNRVAQQQGSGGGMLHRVGRNTHALMAPANTGGGGRLHKPVIKPRKPIAPGQPPPQHRMKDRFVSLPEEVQKPQNEFFRRSDEFLPMSDIPSIFHDVEQGGDVRGRITSYCIAETLDRKHLTETLRRNKIGVQSFPEVLHARHETFSPSGRLSLADVFYFDYGVVVTWNMSLQEERLLLENIVKPAAVDPLDDLQVEVDEFLFHYTMSEKPHIQNDTFTINYRYAGDHLVKLSVSHALAQSIKLSLYEYRVVGIVEETKDLPEILASTGKVEMSRKQVAQLMGRVFLQKSAVNLLSSVLDTPEMFWNSPDSLQNLYEGCTEYLEYENRVEVLNSRFQVLQEMLDMIRDQQNNLHTTRLEWIVIWLILVEIIVGVVECLGMFGLVHGNKEP